MIDASRGQGTREIAHRAVVVFALFVQHVPVFLFVGLVDGQAAGAAAAVVVDADAVVIRRTDLVFRQNADFHYGPGASGK